MRLQGRSSPRFSRNIPHGSSVPAHAAQRQLQSSGRAAFGDVKCNADGDGTVVLRGRVPSFYLKQLAQEIVRKADGVFSVVNELEVDYDHSALAGRQSSMTVSAR